MPLNLNTDVTLNGDTVEITVKQDTTGDTSTDASETVTVPDGSASTELSDMTADDESNYALEISLSSPTVASSPVVHGVTLESIEPPVTATIERLNQVATRTVDLAYSLNNPSSTDRVVIERAAYRDGSWGSWTELAVQPPSTTEYRDGSVPEENIDVRYRLTVYDTEGGTTSTTETITLQPSAYLPGGHDRRKSNDWTVKLQHPAGGSANIIEPNILDGITYTPAVNGLPRIRVPVAYDTMWTNTDWEGAKMWVWNKGKIYPIEQLERVDDDNTNMALVGIGGVELRQHIEHIGTTGDNTPSGDIQRLLVAETAINNNTNYQSNVLSDAETAGEIQSRMYDMALRDFLDTLATNGNFVWEVTTTPDSDEAKPPQLTVNLAKPGAPDAQTVSRPITNYSVTKTVEEAYDYVRVRGSKQSVTDEQFTAPDGTEATIDLDHAGIWPATETVTTPDGLTKFYSPFDYFESGQNPDYFMNLSEGSIDIPSDSPLADGGDYVIDYEWKPVAEYGTPGGNDLTRHLGGIANGEDADNAAQYLYERLQDPLYHGTAEVAYPEPDQTLLAKRHFEGTPFGETGVDIREVEHGRDSVTFTFGSRGTVADYVDQLSTQLSSVMSTS